MLKYHIKKSDAYYEMGNFNDSLETLQKVLELDPNEIQSKFKLGKCYFELKEYKKCIIAFKQYLLQVQIQFEQSKNEAEANHFFVTSVGLQVSLP